MVIKIIAKRIPVDFAMGARYARQYLFEHMLCSSSTAVCSTDSRTGNTEHGNTERSIGGHATSKQAAATSSLREATTFTT